MINSISLTKLRDCGKLESLSTARHNLGFYNNVAFTATYTLSQSTSIDRPSLVYAALREVISAHSILSAIPLDEDTKTPYFARLPEIDLTSCVSFVQRAEAFPKDFEKDGELDQVLEEQHNTNFKSKPIGTQPFWRVVVLHSNESASTDSEAHVSFTLSWIYHHALADGSSGLMFHRAFLSALQSITTSAFSPESTEEESPDPIVKSPTTPLLPPLEDLHPLPLSLLFLLKQQWNDWFPPSTANIWTGNPIPSSVPRMRFKYFVLSHEATSTLVRLSRTNGVTMTATLQCLIAQATFKNLADEKWTTLRGSGPISLRQFLKLPESINGDIGDQIGTWVGAYVFEHHRPSKNIGTGFDWTVAAALKQEIVAELKKDLKDSTVNLLRWVSDVPQFFQEKLGKNRQESFELSNVGVVKINSTNEGEWSMGRCVFSQSASVTGPAFCVSAVTGADGCAVLGFSWLTGAHEEGWMESVMEATREGVERLLQLDGEVESEKRGVM